MDQEEIFSTAENIIGLKSLSPPVRSGVWKAVGLLLIVAGAIILTYQLNSGSRIENGLAGALRSVASLGISYSGAIFYLRGRRIAARPISDQRPPVLYLRSFDDDDRSSNPISSSLPFLHSLSTEEEQLADGLRDIGPLKGLGIPREKGGLQRLGADRRYFSDAQWRDAVHELMLDSKLVVIRIGTTQSLLEEVEISMRELQPARLVLLIADRATYEDFRRLTSPFSRKELPNYPKLRAPILFQAQPSTTVKGIVFFLRDWEPKLIQLLAPRWRVRTPLSRALRSQTRPIYEQLGIPWRPPALSVTKIGAAGLILGFIGCGLLAMRSESSRDSAESDQTSCVSTETEAVGRAHLDLNLPEKERAACCTRRPWLYGC